MEWGPRALLGDASVLPPMGVVLPEAAVPTMGLSSSEAPLKAVVELAVAAPCAAAV